jgi:hypothetical protein
VREKNERTRNQQVEDRKDVQRKLKCQFRIRVVGALVYPRVSDHILNQHGESLQSENTEKLIGTRFHQVLEHLIFVSKPVVNTEAESKVKNDKACQHHLKNILDDVGQHRP